MKKMLWGIVLAMVILNPISANAASIGYYGERWCSGTCKQVYTLTTNDLSQSQLTIDFVLTGDSDQIELDGVVPAEGWSGTATRDGNTITMVFTKGEGASNTLGNLELTLDNYNTDYSAQFEINGEVITVAEATGTLGSDGELTNPDTGAFMNYTLIAGGIGIAATILFLSKKNKKLYKI